MGAPPATGVNGPNAARGAIDLLRKAFVPRTGTRPRTSPQGVHRAEPVARPSWGRARRQRGAHRRNARGGIPGNGPVARRSDPIERASLGLASGSEIAPRHDAAGDHPGVRCRGPRVYGT